MNIEITNIVARKGKRLKFDFRIQIIDIFKIRYFFDTLAYSVYILPMGDFIIISGYIDGRYKWQCKRAYRVLLKRLKKWGIKYY